ncbi:MAG: hypothetical protein U1F09_10710 [Steroidobacteraceae bacterium]
MRWTSVTNQYRSAIGSNRLPAAFGSQSGRHRAIWFCAAAGVALGLTGCGSSQNYSNKSAYVSIGGNVTGLASGKSLYLWNNGQDKLAVGSNGSFRFSLEIANGSSYQVLVATQPDGQTCTVTNGSGVASGNVSSVSISCTTYTYTPRPLPSVYATGKAVNYSPYRADGPAQGEFPSDTDILQDLTLLNVAGYDLIRLFGVRAPGNPAVADRILALAEQYFPDMKFQLGIELTGLTSCSDTSNDRTIAYSIGTLARRSNVVTISVGNETSFYSKYMPLACLTNYIRTVRSQVTQPVTADDDFTFYAGLTSEFGDQVAVRPDAVLAMIDFVSIHMYPISRPDWWNWQQTAVAPGPARAQAMMEAALAVDKVWYQLVADYQYTNADGLKVSTGGSLPIVIGETGWKAQQTNPASAIEAYSALQPNQKWYFDLLYGNSSQGYASWAGSTGGPATIFWFEAYDEAWKGTDDGWGLWTAARTPRYVLCGTPAGPACNSNLYQGAGYYNPGPFQTITFDDPSVSYVLTGFAGAEDSQVVADPVDPTKHVARVVRSASAQTFAGTVVATQPGLSAGIIPFTSTNTRMTVRVYSPAAGTPVRLKVEDSGNPSHSVETQVNTTVAGDWETLTFNFANQVAGTPALNPAFTYDRLAIFFNFGVAGSAAGQQTYYFDDVAFVAGGGGVVFASNYSQIDATHWKSVEGGDAGNYVDSVATGYSWNGVAPADTPPSFYFGYGFDPAAKPWGFGAFVSAPGNGTTSVAGLTNLQITVWGNDELMNTGPTLTLVLRGPSISGCVAEVESAVIVPGPGVQSYTVPLGGFTMRTPCAFATPAQVLAAGVNEVHVQVLGTNVQFVTTAGGFYPNGLNIGPISFN